MVVPNNTFVMPGTIVGSASLHNAGYGVMSSDRDRLVATRAGYVRFMKSSSSSSALASTLSPSASPAADLAKIQISVLPEMANHEMQIIKVPSGSPSVSDWVIARVTRLQQTQVHLQILQIDPNSPRNVALRIQCEPFQEPYKAILRSLDVRSTERDRVKVDQLFRPGDIVRAEVISLGDAGAFYLSTAKAEFGVLSALSQEQGSLMIPISWEEMISPVTLEREKRKVAKPLSL